MPPLSAAEHTEFCGALAAGYRHARAGGAAVHPMRVLHLLGSLARDAAPEFSWAQMGYAVLGACVRFYHQTESFAEKVHRRWRAMIGLNTAAATRRALAAAAPAPLDYDDATLADLSSEYAPLPKLGLNLTRSPGEFFDEEDEGAALDGAAVDGLPDARAEAETPPGERSGDAGAPVGLGIELPWSEVSSPELNTRNEQPLALLDTLLGTESGGSSIASVPSFGPSAGILPSSELDIPVLEEQEQERANSRSGGELPSVLGELGELLSELDVDQPGYAASFDLFAPLPVVKAASNISSPPRSLEPQDTSRALILRGAQTRPELSDAESTADAEQSSSHAARAEFRRSITQALAPARGASSFLLDQTLPRVARPLAAPASLLNVWEEPFDEDELLAEEECFGSSETEPDEDYAAPPRRRVAVGVKSRYDVQTRTAPLLVGEIAATVQQELRRQTEGPRRKLPARPEVISLKSLALQDWNSLEYVEAFRDPDQQLVLYQRPSLPDGRSRGGRRARRRIRSHAYDPSSPDEIERPASPQEASSRDASLQPASSQQASPQQTAWLRGPALYAAAQSTPLQAGAKHAPGTGEAGGEGALASDYSDDFGLFFTPNGGTEGGASPALRAASTESSGGPEHRARANARMLPMADLSIDDFIRAPLSDMADDSLSLLPPPAAGRGYAAPAEPLPDFGGDVSLSSRPDTASSAPRAEAESEPRVEVPNDGDHSRLFAATLGTWLAESCPQQIATLDECISDMPRRGALASFQFGDFVHALASVAGNTIEVRQEDGLASARQPVLIRLRCIEEPAP